MRFSNIWGGALAASLLIALAVHFYPSDPPSQETKSEAATSVAAVAMPASQAIVQSVPVLAPSGTSSAPALSNVKGLSLSTRVDALSKSGSPTEMYEAFKLIKQCATVRRFALMSAEAAKQRGMPVNDFEQQLCGDLSPGQIASRTNLIEKAVRAGVPGAAVDFINQAPDGRPRDEVWNEPAYATWKNEASAYLKSAAAAGDVSAALYLTEFYDTGPVARNPAESIKYYVALGELTKKDRSYTAAQHSFFESSIARLEKELSPAAAASAKAAGKQLAETCCKGR